MAMLCYILAIFTHFLGPLIIWLIKKNDSPFVDRQGKEVLNWLITVLLAWLCCIPLLFVIIGAFLMPLVGLLGLIFLIVGAVQVNSGKDYRFPWVLRLLK